MQLNNFYRNFYRKCLKFFLNPEFIQYNENVIVCFFYYVDSPARSVRGRGREQVEAEEDGNRLQDVKGRHRRRRSRSCARYCGVVSVP